MLKHACDQLKWSRYLKGHNILNCFSSADVHRSIKEKKEWCITVMDCDPAEWLIVIMISQVILRCHVFMYLRMHWILMKRSDITWFCRVQQNNFNCFHDLLWEFRLQRNGVSLRGPLIYFAFYDLQAFLCSTHAFLCSTMHVQQFNACTIFLC